MKFSLMFSGNADVPVEEVLSFCRLAEQKSFDGVWFGETTLRDACVLSSAASMITQRLQIGTSIMSVFTRSPGQLAMAGVTLGELSRDRFVLGLGASTPPIVSGWHGVKYENPLKRVEDTVRILRLYFSGERFSYQGLAAAPTNARLRLGHAPKIALAALNQGMMRLSARLADMVILNLQPPEVARLSVNFIREEALKAGRSPPEIGLMVYAYVVADDERALDAARELIGFYGSSEFYARMFSRAGFSDEASSMLEAWRVHDRAKVKDAVSLRMVQELLAYGSMDSLRNKAELYRRAGIDNILIAPSPFGDFGGNARKILNEFF